MVTLTFASPTRLNAALASPWNLTNEFYIQAGSPAIRAGIDPTAIAGIPAEIITGLNAYVFTDVLGNPRSA